MAIASGEVDVIERHGVRFGEALQIVELAADPKDIEPLEKGRR